MVEIFDFRFSNSGEILAGVPHKFEFCEQIRISTDSRKDFAEARAHLLPRNRARAITTNVRIVRACMRARARLSNLKTTVYSLSKKHDS